jgi:sigma-54 dependent transcriptional regulator, acetoin dehydrogenase operon transcriptional activator AcoR
MLSTADHLVRARALLERSHSAEISHDLLRTEIRNSWQRCLDSGLDPNRPPRQTRLTSQELHALIEQDSYLVHLAKTEFRKLQKQIPGDNFVIGFANREAVLMDVISSNPSGASEVAPGFCWMENVRGTNALGTSAFNRQPVSVHSLEHFFRNYSGLTCTAAPVTDPDGEVVGILDVSSDCHSRQQQTMSLICMSVLHMEAELFRERFRSDIILQFHSRDEFANTLDAGLIALDDEGGILCSNRQARFLLEGLPIEAGRHFDEVSRVPFRDFASRPHAAGNLTQLVDIKGSSYSVRVYNLSISPRASFPTPRPTPTDLAENLPIGFVCRDPVVSRAISMVKRAVEMRIPILIRGETGTGKEMLAQYAHRLSRKNGRFVPVNCAAVPEDLIESELFGYREGAFTGARSGGSAGLVLQADGGTLFLDEIGDMPISLQPALLRFLDNWTVRPIGSSKEQKVDVQLITATNTDLEQAITERRFRRDLLHRIDGVEIFLPPLRERSDFEQIAWDLLGRISPRTSITEDALQLLREQPWEGNIRELRNILTRAMISCFGSILSTKVVESVLHNAHRNGTTQHPHASVLLDLRRNAVLDAYRKNGGNVSKTALDLCVSRNTVYRELRRAGIVAKEDGDPSLEN